MGSAARITASTLDRNAVGSERVLLRPCVGGPAEENAHMSIIPLESEGWQISVWVVYIGLGCPQLLCTSRFAAPGQRRFFALLGVLCSTHPAW